MAIFSKRRDPVAQAEHALGELRARRTKLQAKLVAADADLETAITARRKSLLESDLDETAGAPVRDSVGRLRDERDAISDAIAEIDGKIADGEVKLAQERDTIARESEAKLREGHAAVLGESIAAYRVAGEALADALRTCAGLTDTVFLIGQNIGAVTSEFAAAAEAERHSVGTYIAGVRAGARQIVGQPSPPVLVPVLPPIERQQVLLLADLRWKEYDEVKTGPKFGTWDLPVDVAARAIETGWAVLPDDPLANHLRTTGDAVGNWVAPLPQNCIDLDAEKIALPPPGSYGSARIAGHLKPAAAA